MDLARGYSWTAIVLGLIVAAVGCGDAVRPPVTSAPATDKAEMMRAIAQAQHDSEHATAPPSVIELPTPAGWVRSDPKALPDDDHGFTVGYQHKSGLAVTLYQFTRGLTSIPTDVDAEPVQEEFRRAKNGIEQAVELKLWQAAKETVSKTVTLGDSPQRALWSQYTLTIDGETAVSDIYVWAHTNAFFKLRCTSRSEDADALQTELRPLLTAFGAAMRTEK